DSAAGDRLLNESLQTIRFYHAATLLMVVTVAAIFVIRKWKGWIPLIVSVAILTVSPGWSPERYAGITPWCAPPFSTFVKRMFIVTAACLVAQLLGWKFPRKRNLP